MGSNQGKQPHYTDRGARVWSRDEKRENRNTGRSTARKRSIDDQTTYGVCSECGVPLANEEHAMSHHAATGH